MSKGSPKGFQKGDASEKITFGKVGSLLKSVWSKGLSQTRVDEKTLSLRVISCHGDKSRGISPCEWRRESEKADGMFMCGRCGCGDSPRTWLNGPEGSYTKLDYPDVVCPLQMPGFSNYKQYGQEDTNVSKEFVSARKMNIEFTLYGEGIDLARRVIVDTPEELIGDELPSQPQVEQQKKPCNKCGKNQTPDKEKYPPKPTITERVKNSIDDINLG